MSTSVCDHKPFWAGALLPASQTLPHADGKQVTPARQLPQLRKLENGLPHFLELLLLASGYRLQDLGLVADGATILNVQLPQTTQEGGREQKKGGKQLQLQLVAAEEDQLLQRQAPNSNQSSAIPAAALPYQL